MKKGSGRRSTIVRVAKLLGTAAVAALTWCGDASAALGDAASPAAERTSVGSVEVNLVKPEGLSRVDGLCPEADAFILSLVDRFKLKVLAVYADPDQWRHFAEGLAAGAPRAIPRTAVAATTVKMAGKSYDAKGVAKEKRRFNNWVSLAVNTRPLARLFSSKANKKLTSKLGRDLQFGYRTGQNVGKFNETAKSVSYGVLVSMTLFGLSSDVFATAAALNVGDKFIFLTWIEPDQAQSSIERAKISSLTWLGRLTGLNQPVFE
ncbi:MAG: hypothetical protein LBU12_02460 [Deltaproteobacteria bacterium]|jgi:hypothetical protein|nr:hypothetical protein [Deltaproteobacteria bacterium]